MTTDQTAEAIVEWVVATIPEIESSYDHAAERKTQPLPDVGIEITDVEIRLDDERFPLYQIENTAVLSRQFDILLMVDPEPAQTASDLLASFADQLIVSLASDFTLGGRVPAAALGLRFRFNPPFVRFDDGTKGRVTTGTIIIGEPINIEE